MESPRKRTRQRSHHAPRRKAISTRHEQCHALRISTQIRQYRRHFLQHFHSAHFVGISLFHSAKPYRLQLACSFLRVPRRPARLLQSAQLRRSVTVASRLIRNISSQKVKGLTEAREFYRMCAGEQKANNCLWVPTILHALQSRYSPL